MLQQHVATLAHQPFSVLFGDTELRINFSTYVKELRRATPARLPQTCRAEATPLESRTLSQQG